MEAWIFCYSNTDGAANTFQHKFLNYFMTIFIEYVDHVYVHLNKTRENLMGVPFFFNFKLKFCWAHLYLFCSH